jgi:hypothetical protein
MNRELFAQYAGIRQQQARILQLHESKLQLPEPEEPHLKQTNQSLILAIEAQLTAIDAARGALEGHPEFRTTVTELLSPVAMAILSYVEDEERYAQAFDEARALWREAESEGLELPKDVDAHIQNDLQRASINAPLPVDPVLVLQDAYSAENPNLEPLTPYEQEVLVDLFATHPAALPPVFYKAQDGGARREQQEKTGTMPEKKVKDVLVENGQYTTLPSIYEQIAIMFINGEQKTNDEVGNCLVEKGIIGRAQWDLLGEMAFALAQSEISGYFKREQVSTHWETTTKPGQTFYRLVIDHNPHTASPPPKGPEASPPTPQPPSPPNNEESLTEVVDETSEDAREPLPERVMDSGEWVVLETPTIDAEYATYAETATHAPFKIDSKAIAATEPAPDSTDAVFDDELVPEIPHGEVGDATTSFPDTQLQQEEGAEEASTPGQLNEDHTTPDLDIHKVQPTNDQSDLGNLESDTSPTLSAIAAAVLELTKTGSEYTMGDIRNYLIGHGYMTEDQWKGRNPQFFSKIQNEIVKHLQTQGVKGEWDFRGNTKARVHFLFIARESSNPVALGRLFPTPKQPKPTQDHIHTPRRATVEIPPTPHTTAPHPKHPPTREDRHMATQIERQRESERAVVVRDLTRHLADGEGGRDVDNRWNAVLRTLQTAHPSINIEQIMSGLVESGAYHTVRSNGSKLIYPGPAPETSVVQAPKRGKFEPIGRPDVDFVKENPDIAEQVLVYLATTFTHHTEGETMSTLFDKYGDGLTKEEFNRLLRQMAARGTIQLDSTRNYGRGRKGTIALLPDALTKREIKQDPGFATQILNTQANA